MNKNIGVSSVSDRVKASCPAGVSLRDHVRALVKKGDADAKAWLDNKAGRTQAKRTAKTEGRIAAEKLAKKALQSKKK